MSRLLFDIESDNLLQKVTKCWIIYAFDLDTGEKNYWLNGDLGWVDYFNNATMLVGHNIVGYDIPVLEKLFKWKPKKNVSINDTLLLSQILNYNRFASKRHGLAEWGEYFSFPKGDYSDWTQYTPEMLTYCETDIDLTVMVWNELKVEAKELIAANPYLRTYIKAEHKVSEWAAQASLKGWPFAYERAVALHQKMFEEMTVALDALSHKLGTKVVPVDKKLGVVEYKTPKWVKNGNYNSHTANWFGVAPETGMDEDRLIEGCYSRIEIVPLQLSSIQDVKIFLFRNGWIPLEYNYKMNEETRKMEQKSPKITEESLEFLGGDGKLYCDYLTTSSRYNNLTTWINNTDEDNRLHGDCMTIGTPSMRTRHSIIVNVPSGEQNKDGTAVSPWGKEMRELFTVTDGWAFVGADSAGNQARGLAHYLGSKEYIKLLLEGDIHQYNADILTSVLKSMGIDFVVPRPSAKRILYAFLFGASGAKLWGYIFNMQDADRGNKLKAGFQKAVPGLKELLDKLSSIFSSTGKYGDGYIYGLAGNRIYVDSYHKLLVYLLQAAEKATCGAACMLLMEYLDEAEIPYQPLIMMHDELDFMVPEEHKEVAAKLAVKAFQEGPKLFNVQIMDGGAKIGYNWMDCH